jgi:hypothetical protein
MRYTCPYADLLPPHTPEGRSSLEADIRDRCGVVVPVVVDGQNNVLDGHLRLEIAAALDLPCPIMLVPCLTEKDKRDLALDLNLHRRHLSREQIREVVERRLKEDPTRSDRCIAAEVGADHKTVGATRRDLEVTGEIPQSEETRGADGRTQRRRRAAPSRTQADRTASPSFPAPPPDGVGDGTAGNAKKRSPWPSTLNCHADRLLDLAQQLQRLSKVRVAERNPEDVRRLAAQIRTQADRLEEEACGDARS